MLHLIFRPTQFVYKVGKCTSAGERKFDPFLLAAVALLIRVPFPFKSHGDVHITEEWFTSNVASVNDNRGNSIRKIHCVGFLYPLQEGHDDLIRFSTGHSSGG